MNLTFSIALATSILAPLAASAAGCALPPGTVGIGSYCPAAATASVFASSPAPVLERGAPAPSVEAKPNPPSAPAPEQAISTPSVAAVAVETLKAAPPVSQAALPPMVVQPGQRLSIALGAWLKTQGITLSWEPAGSLPGRMRDIVFDSAWQASDSSLEKTLSDSLQPFGLAALIVKPSDASTAPYTVVVRNSAPTRP